MRRLAVPHRSLLLAACGVLSTLPPASVAQPAADKPPPAVAAMAACERAVRQSLAPRSGDPADLNFTAAPAQQPGISDADHTLLRGSGRWRDGNRQRSFTFSCNVDLRAPDAVGLVLRDATPAAPEAAAARLLPEPDLSHVTPADCEASAAAALKRRWPAVSQISFDSGSRRLQQESASKAELRGQGRAVPSPDAPATHFGFACELDPRDGRVLALRVTG